MVSRERIDYDRLCRIYQRTFAAPPPEQLFETQEAGIRLMTFAVFTGAALTESGTAEGDD